MATITQTIKVETEGADKAAEQFKAIGDAAEKSAQQGTDSFEKFGAAAAKIGSVAQEAGAAFGELGQPISKMGEAVSSAAPAVSQFKQAVVGLADGLREFGKGTAGIGSGLALVGQAATKAASVTGTLGVSLQAASFALGSFGKELGPLLPMLTTAGVALTTFAAAVPMITAALTAATPYLVAFAAAFPEVAIVAGVITALGALAAAFYFAGGAGRENAAALKELSGSTGQSVESLKRQQEAFVAAGGSAEGYVAFLKRAGEVAAELGPKMAQMTKESAEAVKATADQALEAEKKLIEAKQRLEALGGPRVSFEENARLVDIIRMQTDASQGRAKAERDVEQAAIASGAASAKAAQAAVDAWGPLVEKMRAVAAGAKDITFDSLTTAETKIKAAAFAFDEANKNGTATNETAKNLVLTLNGIPADKVSAALKVPEDQIEKIRRIDEILKDTTQKPIPNAFQWISQAFDSVMAMLGPKAAEARASVDAATTTPTPGAWAWISATFNSAAAGIDPAAAQAPVGVATTTPVDGAWQWIVATYNSVVAQVNPAAAQAAAAAATTTPTPGAWQWIADAWNAMLAKLGFGGGSSAAPAGGTVPGAAGGGLLGGRGTGTSDSNLAWVSRGEYIVPARVVQQPGVLAFLEALRRSGNLHRARGFAGGGLIPAFAGGGLVDEVENMARNVAVTLNRVAETLDAAFIEIVDHLEGAFEQLGTDVDNSFRRLVRATWDSFEKIQDKLEEHAGGGLLGGRGTGTSDSNLAWVSRGEHIMPARAVSQPGVLAFLEALRRSGGNLRGILDGMGRFALGGLVAPTLSLPAFAGGGAMNNVTIQFPGLPEITGLRAPSAVVDELRKAAAMAQVRSGGRKPSRYS